MSEAFRGVEVHGDSVIIPDLKTGITIGSRGAPITQTEIMEAVIQGWVTTTDIGIGWDVHGGHFGVYAGESRTGDIVGVEGRAYVNDGVTIEGHVYGGHLRIYALDGAIVSNTFEGLHISLNVEAGATMSAEMCGIYISNVCNVAHVQYSMIRLEENGAATLQSLISAFIGAGVCSYVFHLDATETAWDNTGEKSDIGVNENGWLRCLVNGVDRYIQLYEA